MSQSESGALSSDDIQELERIVDVIEEVLDGGDPDPDLLRFAGMFLLSLSERLDSADGD
jgi:hypothetical protein